MVMRNAKGLAWDKYVIPTTWNWKCGTGEGDWKCDGVRFIANVQCVGYLIVIRPLQLRPRCYSLPLRVTDNIRDTIERRSTECTAKHLVPHPRQD